MVTVEEGAQRRWTLLTNHGRVLLLVAQNPQVRLRDIAQLAGITERSAQSIVADLEHEGYLHREKMGRRNVYSVHPEKPFRHPAEAHHTVGELFDLFGHTASR